MSPKRTKAQQALLDRLPPDGSPKNLNGRARSMVEALAKEGAITYEYDLRPSAIGKWSEIYTVRRVVTR